MIRESNFRFNVDSRWRWKVVAKNKYINCLFYFSTKNAWMRARARSPPTGVYITPPLRGGVSIPPSGGLAYSKLPVAVRGSQTTRETAHN